MKTERESLEEIADVLMYIRIFILMFGLSMFWVLVEIAIKL